MSELVKFLSLLNPLELCSHHFPAKLCQPVGFNKDPILWPDRDRPTQVCFQKWFKIDKLKNLNNSHPTIFYDIF